METRHLLAVGAVAAALALLTLVTARSGAPDLGSQARFTPDPSRDVVVYTTSWCGACAAARRFLDANDVVYREIDIEESQAGRREYRSLGGNGVPVFVIDGRVIHGLDWRAVVDGLALVPEARAS